MPNSLIKLSVTLLLGALALISIDVFAPVSYTHLTLPTNREV